MPTVTLPIAEWMPDLFPPGSPGASTITNVVPKTPTTYGPMLTPAVYSGALGSRIIGSYTLRDPAKNVYVFSGDMTNLYLLRAGSTNFTDISGATYTGSPWPDTQWFVTSFGLRVIATNYNDPMQTYLVGTDGIFSALATPVTTTVDTHSNTTLDAIAAGTANLRVGMVVSGTFIPANTFIAAVISPTEVSLSQAATGTASATAVTFTSAVPKARYVEAVGDFVVAAYTNDDTNGVQPQRVQWSAIGDPTSWPTPGTVYAIQVQSDYQDLQQTDLGQITGLAAGPLPTASMTIFCEHGVYIGTYVGSPSIFAFRAVDGAPGCLAPHSIVKGHINSGGAMVPVIFYLAPDGFYAFNGTSSTGIGANKIDRFFFSDLDPKLSRTVLGSADPVSKLIYWAYSTAASPSLYDRLVVYNWDINRWSYVDLTAAKIEWFSQTATVGYTLEELDQFGTLETLPYSLDSEAWVGGTPRFGVFDSSHQMAYLTGNNMAAIVETAESEPQPGRRVFIRNVFPLLDGYNAAVALGLREHPAAAVTLKPAVAINSWGQCPQRWTGRYIRARLTTPAGATFTHIGGVEIDLIDAGIRGPIPEQNWLYAEDGVTHITDEFGNWLLAE